MAKKLTSLGRDQKWLSGSIMAALAASPVIFGLSAAAQESAYAASPMVNGAEPMVNGDMEDCAEGLPNRSTLSRESLVLNGAPSALERIRLSQRNADTAAKPISHTPQSIVMRSLANRPIVNSLAPASRTSLKLGEIRAQMADAQCGYQDGGQPRKPFRDEGVDAMGTMPIEVRRTAFDDRWDRVRRAPPLALMQTYLNRAGVTEGMEAMEIFARVNRWVNQSIAYVADDVNYGQRDYWASAAETLSKMSGDCEDYAVLKMHLLRAAGVSANRIKLMLLRDLAGNRDHAFLVVSHADGETVLDNTTNRVYAASAAVAVRPVLSFSGDRRWVHGMRNNWAVDAAFEAVPAAAAL